MSNATQRTRRPKSAVGANPPRIAKDIHHVAAACQLAAGRHPDATSTEAMAAVLVALPARLSRPLGDVAADVLVAYLGSLTPAPSAAALPALRAELVAVFNAAEWPSSIDDAIAGAQEAGFDGDVLCEALIVRESNAHHGLIYQEAARLAKHLPNCEVDELTGYGWRGVRSALRAFDPALGFTFSTYAIPKINGAIRDGIRSEHHLPKRLTTLQRLVSATEEKLVSELSRTPTFEEIAANLDVAKRLLEMIPRLGPSASLEEMAASWGDKHRDPACLIDSADPAEHVLGEARSQALRDAVAALPADQRDAVELLFFQEVPIGEAAAKLGVDTRSLRAAKKRALDTLRPMLAGWVDQSAGELLSA